MLRSTVTRPVFACVRHSCKAHYQIPFCQTFAVKLMWGPLCDEKTILHFSAPTGPCQNIHFQSKSWRIHHSILPSQMWHFPSLEGQDPVFVSPRNGVVQLYSSHRFWFVVLSSVRIMVSSGMLRHVALVITDVSEEPTWHNIPEDTILHSHRRENLKSYSVLSPFNAHTIIRWHR
jgi:hypothetical protein